MIHHESTLSKFTPLSSSITKLLDAALNLQASQPNIVLMSGVFNSTTWRNLSYDTKSVIREAGKSWMRKFATDMNTGNYTKLNALIGTPDSFTKVARMYQLVDATVELLAGGDFWQTLRTIYENARMRFILTLIEDLPSLVVSGVDTFVKSERLNDFVEKLSLGKVHPCDIDKYLIVPSFVRRRVLLSSVTNFCQRIVLTDKQLTLIDLLPLDAKYEVQHQTVELLRRRHWLRELC